jgi:transcriptional regulator with XRE-family HTH domain
MSNVNIGDFIIKVRQNYGITQKDLGEQLGVTAQAVSKWERGENFPDTEILLRISQLYKVSIDDLLLGKSNGVTQNRRALKELRFLFAGLLIILGSGYFIYSGFDTLTDIIIVVSTLILGSIVLLVTIKNKDHYRVTLDNVTRGVYILAMIAFLSLGLLLHIFYVSWLAFPLGYVVLLFIKKN